LRQVARNRKLGVIWPIGLCYSARQALRAMSGESTLAQPSVDDFERVILPKRSSAFPATGPSRSSFASRCGSCPWAARS
jgi:hypothetical protein